MSSPEPVRWGVLGTARIAVAKVIPGMRRCRWSRVVAIASRDPMKARQAADVLGLESAYGSYEELLADPDVEVVYNPLPNHLHVPWSIRAADAGKHVLCEKPFALNVAQARRMVEAAERSGTFLMEAIWSRFLPLVTDRLTTILYDQRGYGRSPMWDGSSVSTSPTRRNPSSEVELGSDLGEHSSVPELTLIEPGIESSQLHQLVVGPFLHNPAAIQDD
jgi:hypothetical protein